MKVNFIFWWVGCGLVMFGGLLAPEALAANCTVAALTDTGAGTGGAGDLRFCINQTNFAAGADSINFTVHGSIPLNGGLPTITDSLIINGNNGIIIDGQNGDGVLPVNIVAGVSVSVSIGNLTVTRGNGTMLTGGGIELRGGATLNLTNVKIDNCTTVGESGSGLYAAGSHLNVVNSRITNNYLSEFGGSGAGIFVDGGTFSMRGSVVSSNSLANSNDIGGAGIELFAVSTAQIENSIISENRNGQFGVGIANKFGHLRMSNVTVSNNTGGENAGGLGNTAGTVILRNCTIAGNSVSRRGGGISNLHHTGVMIIANTVIADNTAMLDGADVLNFAELTRVGANIVETPVSNFAVVNGTGTIANVDPLLLPLGNYGGIVRTQALAPNSPARNAGTNAAALDTADAPQILTFDTRGTGFPRFNENTVDVGAFESSAVAASYGVSGRVLTENGVLRSRPIVRLTDLNTGGQRLTVVNPFGFYRFLNVPAGADVRVEAAAKNAVFIPQTVTVAGEINSLNFAAQHQ